MRCWRFVKRRTRIRCECGALHPHQDRRYGRCQSRLGPWRSRASPLIPAAAAVCPVFATCAFRSPPWCPWWLRARHMKRSSPSFPSSSSKISARPCATQRKRSGSASCRCCLTAREAPRRHDAVDRDRRRASKRHGWLASAITAAATKETLARSHHRIRWSQPTGRPELS